MHTSQRLLGILTLALALLAFGRPPLVQAAPTLVTVDMPTSDGVYGLTRFVAINDTGAILGGDGVLTDVLTLTPKTRVVTCTDDEAPGMTVEAINRHGEVVGGCGIGAFFLNKAGVYQKFRYPGAATTSATGINNTRQIVGHYQIDETGSFFGFRYEKGMLTPLDVSFPGTTATVPTGINHAGTVVGFYADDQLCHPDGGGCFHGFVLRRGVFEQLDAPIEGDETLLFGLNDHGHILGVTLVGGIPFLYFDGTFYNLQAPGESNTTITFEGINNRLQMVGTMTTYDATNPDDPWYLRGVLRQWDKREGVPVVPTSQAAGATMMATRTLLRADAPSDAQGGLCASLLQSGMAISAKLTPVAHRCSQAR